VKQISRFILFLILFAATFVVGANAQVSSASAQTAIAKATASAHEEVVHPLVSQSALTIFNIGPLPVTNSMICTWIVALLIIVIVRLTVWKVKEIPGTGQNVMEAVLEGWENLMGNVLEPKVVQWVFPLAASFLIFITISNFTDLLPGMGSIGLVPVSEIDKTSALPHSVPHVATPFFRPPTTDANLTVAMAGIFFVMSLYWALKYNGPVGLVKHVFGVKVATTKWLYPLLLLLFIFIGVMESFSILFIRPVALALRLYGNIFGGETMLTMAMSQKSVLMAVLLALPGYFFETVVCLLQAFVFAMLTVAFAGTLCTHADEEEGH
jgi:F-type H+-transporting ATPase subunit a